jgi:hypothetical protein
MSLLADPSRPVFLDTTVVIERLFGPGSQRTRIESFLQGRRVQTSTWVLFEYKRVLQKTCVDFHCLLSRTRDWSEALRLFSRSFSFGQLSAGYLLLPELLPAQEPVEAQLRRLETLIHTQLVPRFRDSVDEITDATGCRMAWQEPVCVGSTYQAGFLSVARATFDCDLPEFIEANRGAFESIRDALTMTSSRSLVRLRNLLALVLKDPAQSRGRNALILGDVIIAVEMSAQAVLLTTNSADFGPLCAALGKGLWPLDV